MFSQRFGVVQYPILVSDERLGCTRVYIEKKKKEDRDVGLPNVQIMCASFEYLENVPAPLKGNKIGVVVPKEVTSQTI